MKKGEKAYFNDDIPAAISYYEKAAAARRKAIEIDPSDTSNYRELVGLILLHNLSGDWKALLAAGEKYQESDDLFGEIMDDFFYLEETKTAEKLAAAEPLRMRKSALANRSLGELFTEDGRYVEAERLLNMALRLYKESEAAQKQFAGSSVADTYVALAKLYRKQSRWLSALKAADQAIALNAKDHEAYFQRACALARLRRSNEAIAALGKSIELFAPMANDLSTETDLKSLSTLPGFQKLLPPAKKEP